MEMECLELTYKKPQQPRSLNGYYYGYDNWDWEVTKTNLGTFREEPKPPKVAWSREMAREFGVEYYGSSNLDVQKAKLQKDSNA
jgi:hypothetical protein